MNDSEKLQANPVRHRTVVGICRGSCHKLVAQIERTKNAILNDFRATLAAHEHLLRLAVTEAEALAWQTDFPHLVFPTLAMEKAEAVVAWQTRQQFTHRVSSRFVRGV